MVFGLIFLPFPFTLITLIFLTKWSLFLFSTCLNHPNSFSLVFPAHTIINVSVIVTLYLFIFLVRLFFFTSYTSSWLLHGLPRDKIKKYQKMDVGYDRYQLYYGPGVKTEPSRRRENPIIIYLADAHNRSSFPDSLASGRRGNTFDLHASVAHFMPQWIKK